MAAERGQFEVCARLKGRAARRSKPHRAGADAVRCSRGAVPTRPQWPIVATDHGCEQIRMGEEAEQICHQVTNLLSELRLALKVTRP